MMAMAMMAANPTGMPTNSPMPMSGSMTSSLSTALESNLGVYTAGHGTKDRIGQWRWRSQEVIEQHRGAIARRHRHSPVRILLICARLILRPQITDQVRCRHPDEQARRIT